MPEHSESLERVFERNLSDVGLEGYAGVLDLTLSELMGKTILDIGSGLSNGFANETMQNIPDSSVISVNPYLAFPERCQELDIPVESHKLSVAALAQGFLPFRSESFNTVVSVMAVPNALLSTELPDLFNDIWRILKPGGIAKLWPFAFKRVGDREVERSSEISFEEVDPEVLEKLPSQYQRLSLRIVIKKPAEKPSNPVTEISRLAIVETQ